MASYYQCDNLKPRYHLCTDSTDILLMDLGQFPSCKSQRPVSHIATQYVLQYFSKEKDHEQLLNE